MERCVWNFVKFLGTFPHRKFVLFFFLTNSPLASLIGTFMSTAPKALTDLNMQLGILSVFPFGISCWAVAPTCRGKTWSEKWAKKTSTHMSQVLPSITMQPHCGGLCAAHSQSTWSWNWKRVITGSWLLLRLGKEEELIVYALLLLITKIQVMRSLC